MLRRADVRHAADVVENLARHALLRRHRGVGGIWPCRLSRSLRLPLFRLFASRRDRLSAQRKRDLAVVRRIRHDDGRRRIVARRADRRLVELDENIALPDLRPLLHMRREILALQVHRVEADVDEQIDAVHRMKPDRVLRRKKHRDFAIKRGDDLPLRALHRRAAPHELPGKRRIVDLLQREELSLQGAFQP